MDVIIGFVLALAGLWVIGFVISLVIYLILKFLGLIKYTTSGALVLFSWASTECGFIGIAILFICWGTVPIVMVIASTLIGFFIETESDDDSDDRDGGIPKSTDYKKFDEPLSEYEKKRGF